MDLLAYACQLFVREIWHSINSLWQVSLVSGRSTISDRKFTKAYKGMKLNVHHLIFQANKFFDVGKKGTSLVCIPALINEKIQKINAHSVDLLTQGLAGAIYVGISPTGFQQHIYWSHHIFYISNFEYRYIYLPPILILPPSFCVSHFYCASCLGSYIFYNICI